MYIVITLKKEVKDKRSFLLLQRPFVCSSSEDLVCEPHGKSEGFASRNAFNSILRNCSTHPVSSCFTVLPFRILIILRKIRQAFANRPVQTVYCQLSSKWTSPLCHLFYLSLKLSNFPTPWKSAVVHPVPERGDPLDYQNITQ